MNKKIAITTGDTKGIGKELVFKALNYIKPNKDDVVIIGEKIEGLDCETIEIDSKNNGEFCFESLKVACDMALKGVIKGIVTAPVSKEELHKSGYKFNGQTEILEKFLGDENHKAEMLFIADDLRVMLLTRHLALCDIKITEDMIRDKVYRLNNFLIEKCGIKKPKIMMCGLNPHAGENGILGDEEIKIINPAIKKLQDEGIEIEGTKPADAIFAKVGKNFINKKPQEYDAIISTYHDQGLVAVKALAFENVVNTTIGLKVIRTSPSGGTAYDIAGKNIADAKSMIEAIKLAFKIG